MKERFSTILVAAVMMLAFAGCSRQNSNGATGNADRTQPTNAGEAYTPPTGFDSSHGTAGSTAGAASGSLQTHERGGGSDGTGVATRPEAGAPLNVDPKYARRNGATPAPQRDPSVPDPQGKQ